MLSYASTRGDRLDYPPTLGLTVTVLGLVGGAPGGETPRVADSSVAGAGCFFHNSNGKALWASVSLGTLASQRSPARSTPGVPLPGLR